MLKIPSLDFLFNQIQKTFLRFPLTILFAIGISSIGIYFTMQEKAPELENIAYRFMLFCILGLSLSLSLHLFSERHKQYQASYILLGGIGVLGVYIFVLQGTVQNFVSATRFFILLLVAHLMVAFVPYTAKGQENGFWQYNQVLFLRILMSLFYSIVLFGGISIALVSIYGLFGVDVGYKTYIIIWILISVLLNTLLFLSGVPDDFEVLDSATVYPIGLKIFAQYVLLPLITLYGFILYAYGIKILVSFQLPKGLVIGLLSVFCIVSILSMLLLHPIRNTENNRWISIFNKWFYIAITPLLLLYFLAIGVRISEYGLTENRIWVLLAGLWMLGTSIYFTWLKDQRIKYIPTSIALIAFLSVVGPWNAYNIAKYVQANRFGAILARNNLLSAGKFKEQNKVLTEKDNDNLRNIISFFSERNNFEPLQPYFKEDFKMLNKGVKNIDKKRENISNLLENVLKKNDKEEKNKLNLFFTPQSPKKDWRKIKTYDYLLSNINLYRDQQYSNNQDEDTQKQVYDLGDFKISLSLNPAKQALMVEKDGKLITTISLKNTADNLFKRKEEEGSSVSVTEAELTVVSEGAKYKFLLFLDNINISQENKKTRIINSIKGELIFVFDK